MFGGHRYCGSGDTMFLTYHLTYRDHMFKELCDLIGSKFLTVTHHLSKFCGHRPYVRSDTEANIF